MCPHWRKESQFQFDYHLPCEIVLGKKNQLWIKLNSKLCILFSLKNVKEWWFVTIVQFLLYLGVISLYFGQFIVWGIFDWYTRVCSVISYIILISCCSSFLSFSSLIHVHFFYHCSIVWMEIVNVFVTMTDNVPIFLKITWITESLDVAAWILGK